MATTEESGMTFDEREQRKKKVREELAKSGRKKKGFMTPERKKKLRVLLTNHLKHQLKEEQLEKERLRKKIVAERVGEPKDFTKMSDYQLKALCKEYHARIVKIEGEKWDLEKETATKDSKIEEDNIAVNNLRGKFVKPSLKKVSKYENKFAKLQKKAAEFNFRQNLKVVKKKEFSLCEEDNEKRKPDWTAGKSKSFSSEAPPDSPTLSKKQASPTSSESEGEEDEE